MPVRTVKKTFPILISFFVAFSTAYAEPKKHHEALSYDAFSGFLEIRNGWRIDNDSNQKDAAIAEGKLQLGLEKDTFLGVLKFKNDFTADLISEKVITELRELNLLIPRRYAALDYKIGRQIISWGAGDILTINDFFPKDWESLYMGCGDEYLNAPADALKASFFLEPLDIDLVYLPVFNGSKYINGSRMSYWNSSAGKITGRERVSEDQERNRVFHDAEFAARAAKRDGKTEFAAYFYSGFWKTPEGYDPIADQLFYPRLAVYGVGVRTPVADGTGNAEAGYYQSRQDINGDNPNIRNSEIRLLTGYETKPVENMIINFQYYCEWMQDYKNYKNSLLAGNNEQDEFRHVLSLRITKHLMNRDLQLSLLTVFSPSDEDAYIRPKIHYRLNDTWSAELGGNYFKGEHDHTFFGQYEDNSNVFAGVRMSY